MNETTSRSAVLGAQWAESSRSVERSRGLLRRRHEWVHLPPLRFLDWTVDGTPLRDRFVTPESAVSEITWMIENSNILPRTIARLTTASLSALLPGESSPIDRDVQFGDGRVAILFCRGGSADFVCGDLGCGAVSAEIHFSEDVVEWRDVTYQDAIADELWTGMPRCRLRFERKAYEATVRELLNEWKAADRRGTGGAGRV